MTLVQPADATRNTVETTKIDIPVTHRDIFYNLPIKIMWPFKNATALNNTICMLSDPQVNHPTYQMGELEPLEERVHATVSRFYVRPSTNKL